MNTLTLEQSEHVINRAISKAEQLNIMVNIMVNIAIVDSAGYLINFKRMDGALYQI